MLDTWFSSALWPFSTMGWPDKTDLLKTFYPTSVLVTAFDILFFWVARMMMMGIHFMGEIPFKDVYIHALVRDEDGKKMSKSKGNVIDPLGDRRVRHRQRFASPWPPSRPRAGTSACPNPDGGIPPLYQQDLERGPVFPHEPGGRRSPEGICPRPVLPARPLDSVPAPRRHETVDNGALDAYRFNEAAGALYQFIWHEFCDWYLEMAKPELYGNDESAKKNTQKVLWVVLTETLTLMHPVMPFVTQEIWSHLPTTGVEDLACAPFPAARRANQDEDAAREMELFQGVVSAVRNIRTELGIDPAKKLTVLVRTATDQDRKVLQRTAELAKFLARLETLEAGPDVSGPKASGSAVVRGCEVYVPLEGAVDFEDELARLDKELGKVDKEFAIVSKKLANEGFVSKAPAEVVQKERDKLAVLEEKRDKLTAHHKRLQSAMG